MRWPAAPEGIGRYRQLMEHRVIYTEPSYFSSPDMQQLLARYQRGQLTTEQFIREGEGRLQLMRLERE